MAWAMDSPTYRLLDELSWEGNARKYRGGGHRLENVLTAEVFGHLDLLPRSRFLAEVLDAATGADAARTQVRHEAEELAVEVLPGDLAPRRAGGDPTGWKVQPDVLLDGPSTFTYIEAKAAHGGRFGTRQIVRSLIAALDVAGSKTPLVLLVTGDVPPWPVQGHGRLPLLDAVEVGLTELRSDDADHLRRAYRDAIAWITWRQIADAVKRAGINLGSVDQSVSAALTRTRDRVVTAIDAAYTV